MRSATASRARWNFAELQTTLAPYFEPEAGGNLMDQAWQPRPAEGMVRAYRVAGFGHQAVNALHPSQPLPGPRLYHGSELPDFRGLRHRCWSRGNSDRNGSTLDGRRARITAAELSLPVSYEQAALRELTASTQSGLLNFSKAARRSDRSVPSRASLKQSFGVN